MSISTNLASAALALASDASASFEAIIANANGRAQDQFHEAGEVPALPSDVILIPLKDATKPWPDPLTAGSFRYENGRLILSYSASQGSNAGIRGTAPIKHWNEIAVWSVVKPAGSFEGANAFGASTSVAVFERLTVEFRFNEGSDYPEGIFQSAELEMPPSEARALAAVAALEIRLEDPSDITRQADCQFAVRPARLDRPIEVRDTICTVPVRLKSLRLVRMDTGTEIPTSDLRSPR